MSSLSHGSFFIKDGYRPNFVQNTFDNEGGEAYWTQERIKISAKYQFDVYADALRQLPATGRLLDIGCGPPQKLNRMLGRDAREVWLVDQPSTVALAKRLLPSANFVAANLEEIDIDLGVRFDVIICADVIEHLVNPDPCLAFIRRHLDYEGVAFISTPERDVLRGRNCMDSPHPMHVREWNQTEFCALLEAREFLIERQYLVPQQKLPSWKKWLGRLMNVTGMPPAWYSCQVAVCR
jgi:2-polyprenyl-3-methyl-5-hydroxy-6-metoxy-1,4-benzoquinol methylase